MLFFANVIVPMPLVASAVAPNEISRISTTPGTRVPSPLSLPLIAVNHKKTTKWIYIFKSI